jgi:hydroxylamine reductase
MQALAKALNCGINDLPVSLAVSWFEQKAVAVLLSLLHLGVKNVYLGPKLPAFVTPAALGLLNREFGLTKTGTAQEDLRAMMARHSA